MKVMISGCKVGIEVMDSGNRDRELSAFTELYDQDADVGLPDDIEDEDRRATVHIRPAFVDFDDLDLRLVSYTDDLIVLRHADEKVTVNVGIFRQNAGRILGILGCEHPGQTEGE